MFDKTRYPVGVPRKLFPAAVETIGLLFVKETAALALVVTVTLEDVAAVPESSPELSAVSINKVFLVIVGVVMFVTVTFHFR